MKVTPNWLRTRLAVDWIATHSDSCAVSKSDGEGVFNVEGEVCLREPQGLKIMELSAAQELAEQNKEFIIKKWHEHRG